MTQKRRHQDPYAIAQAKARKAANLSRQEVLRKERTAALGDPVKGVETPYLRSFDTGLDPNDPRLNFSLREEELKQGIQHSAYLSTPASSQSDIEDFTTFDSTSETRAEARKEEQDTAQEALRRISNLSLADSKGLFQINTQRIISDFGRHQTDTTLPPRPASAIANPNAPAKTPRVGPDTGSSEVQIALLTAKIRTLSQFLETRGTMDKMNKRNLRLLVHRRQKLMAYLRRKERGGPRWKNLVETLGLTEGMWRGQIVLDRNMRRIEPGTLKHQLYKEKS